MRSIVEAAARRVPVVAGVASTTTAGAVAQARAYSSGSASTAYSPILEAYFPLGIRRSHAYFAPSPMLSALRSCSTRTRSFQRAT